MKLLIDTSNSEKIVVEIDGHKEVRDARVEKSQKLLVVIQEMLTERGVQLSDLTQIEVNTGPGSFTGIRVGVSVANALGWTLNIPVNGQNVKNSPIEAVYQ